MIRKAGKHEKGKQTGKDLCRKALNPAHLFLCLSTMHELHNRKYFYRLLFWAQVTTFCILPAFVLGQSPYKNK